MGQTVTVDEFRGRFVPDFLAEVVQGHEPLIVRLDNGKAVMLQQYEPSETASEQHLELKPLLTLPGSVPSGWKDALYDEQH